MGGGFGGGGFGGGLGGGGGFGGGLGGGGLGGGGGRGHEVAAAPEGLHQVDSNSNIAKLYHS